MAKGFEDLFSIQLGDYYRIFLEIRMRKNNQTKLLDFLKTCIQNKIVEADG
ncbi:RteC domain-containing protein [Galbibacter sp.]|uniref:RteC domain-containing protein n=1 Tax=Galbibacter sp. TaxID=2918471 RepID=UPI003A920587